MPSFTQVPPDMSSPIFPWVSIPNAIRGGAAMVADVGRILNGLGLTRFRENTSLSGGDRAGRAVPWSIADMTRLLAKNLNPYKPDLYFNTVNLKQFRDSTNASSFCYQGVTNAVMRLSKFNAGGLLGDVAMMCGDPTGGYRVQLYKWPGQPVVDALGLEVAREWDGDGVKVAELKPVCPLWMDVDMRYGAGDALAWRTAGKPWTVPQRPHKPGAADAKPNGGDGPTTLETHEPSRYNTTLGTSLDLTGPFDFPNTTLRVLPLLADTEVLKEFVQGYLNDPLDGSDGSPPTGHSFEPWGRYVYLVATSYEEMASDSNNVGAWADNDVVFYVPVRWYHTVNGKKQLRTVALVPVFAFADGTTVAITRSEVTGIPTQKADIVSPPDSWMNDAGPSDQSPHGLLRVRAQVLPVMGMGQPTDERTLIEVTNRQDVHAWEDYSGWHAVAQTWGRTTHLELMKKKVWREDHRVEIDQQKALGVALLTGQLPIRFVMLKQFRDTTLPVLACYQSLSELERRIERVYNLQEIEDRILVRIHRYSNRPIMKSLGLIPKSSDYSGAAPVDSFQAVRPFWMKVAMREELACRVLFRAGETTWEENPESSRKASLFASDPELQTKPDVGPSLVTKIENARPQRLKDHVSQWVDSGPSDRITSAQAVRAIETMGPQLAIESVLSNEWEHWGNPRWYQAYQEVNRRMKDAVRGYAGTDIARRELEFAKETIGHLNDLFAPGRPEVAADVQARIEGGREICDFLQELEGHSSEYERLLRTTDSSKLDPEEHTRRVFASLEKSWPTLTAGVREEARLPVCEEWLNPNPFSRCVDVARRLWSQGKEEAMLRVSKMAQPPEAHVRRDCLGVESTRYFTPDLGVGPDRIWYVGPKVSVAYVGDPLFVDATAEEIERERVSAEPPAQSDAPSGESRSPGTPDAPAKESAAGATAAKGSRSKRTSRSRRAASKRADG